MVNDEWVGAAMTNDMVVVELLIHLRQSQAVPKSQPLTAAAVPLSWGLKQPRSRLTSRWKDADSTRCSPNTPLSWSGAASPSVTADGCEESSRPSPVSQQAPRSKGASECTANSASSTKRCRKNKEIATLSASFKEQRARNENLKRIKLDLGSTSKRSPSSTPGEIALQAQADSKAGKTESSGESGFLIPDLNMMPSEGDCSHVE